MNVSFVSSVKLLEAAARNDIEEVKALLEVGVNPDSTNEDGLTALHQCCIDDSEEMMRLLVQHSADVNAQDSEKWTPLHAAATCGHLHLAKFLIARGANLLAVNADGNMPYDICEDDATLDYIEGEMASRGVTQGLIDETRSATETRMLNHLKMMKSQGQSLMFRDNQGATPLHVAAANGYVRVVEYLLSQSVPTEARDHDDWAPLHAAACWGHPDVLEMLVQNGANLHARTKNQETPYDICEDAELRERIMQLINEQETKRITRPHKEGGDACVYVNTDQIMGPSKTSYVWFVFLMFCRLQIRRSHSNTRTQSVRRTSIREKTLTPKKEAQEEARIRLQMDNKKKPMDSEQQHFQDNNPASNSLRTVKEGEGSPMTSFPAVIADTTAKTSPTNKMLITTTSITSNKTTTHSNNKSPSITRNTNTTANIPIPTSVKDELMVEEEEEELKKEQREKEKDNTTVYHEEKSIVIPSGKYSIQDFLFSLATILQKRERDLLVRSNSSTISCRDSKPECTAEDTGSIDVADAPQLATPPIPPPRTSSNSRSEVIAGGSGSTNGGSGMVTHSGEGGSKIDIHVTVTVNPFSPGTLADLKKQRALSRASQNSYTLSPASSTASTYSLSTSDYDSRPHPRGSEFSASSVRVDTVVLPSTRLAFRGAA
ncbi:Protein phosphatase 1 regulatory inhibitor subunit 16B [Chionoecetes opilio]|uniref:Protein phosphatase 1 regulatory inhibitor subunit 16B n=1 Tax=Chionoecetes opilio TaxID=41210 RepID=A0A8J8WCB1_CHIOP|nr:Protein phosphatase 1 regulatory inhibitor subunit 16B [Chionoecetes opilio]